MDASTLNAVNAYLQSMAPAINASHPQQQLPQNLFTQQPQQHHQNGLANQFYQGQYQASVPMNPSMVSYQQILGLMAQQPPIPAATGLNTLNGTTFNAFDPSLLAFMSSPPNPSQNSQLSSQLLAMELARQAAVQKGLISESLLRLPHMQMQPQPVVQGQSSGAASRKSQSPNSDSDVVSVSGRKRRHRNDVQVPAKHSLSQRGSPLSIADVPMRNRAFTCPESMRQVKAQKLHQQQAQSTLPGQKQEQDPLSKKPEIDNNKVQEPKQVKEEIDPGSPQRHHPDNVPKIDYEVQLMEQLALFYMINSLDSASTTTAEELGRKKVTDKRYRPIWDSSRENSPEREEFNIPSVANSMSPMSVSDEPRKPIPNIPIADVHRLLEDVLNTTQV